MIRKILAVMVSELESGTCEEELDIEAVKRMQSWIQEIDHENELVPLEEESRLSRLMASLKGAELNAEEHRLVARIIKN